MNGRTFVSNLALVAGLLTVNSAQAQVAISEEGITFPDNKQQTAAVIVPMNCPHGDAIVWDTNASSWVCETDLSVICPCAVGETGPAGGIVFHITDGGLHGLEAAPAPGPGAYDPTMPWCPEPNHQTDIDGVVNLGSEVTVDPNSGATNTPLIAGVCGATSAAGVAAAYVWPNDQTDGFLPNKEELDLMYDNLHDQSPRLGGFSMDNYWSSSEKNIDYAWSHSFPDGGQNAYGKSSTLRVRAIRAF